MEVVRRVRDDVALAAGVARGARVPEPVESDAQHPELLEGGHEQVAVLASFAELGQRAVVERDLPDPTSVPIRQTFRSAAQTIVTLEQLCSAI